MIHMIAEICAGSHLPLYLLKELSSHWRGLFIPMMYVDKWINVTIRHLTSMASKEGHLGTLKLKLLFNVNKLLELSN